MVFLTVSHYLCDISECVDNEKTLAVHDHLHFQWNIKGKGNVD
jgi:hypothetical protein